MIRGYDSTNLFREDILLRIRRLEREIFRDLKNLRQSGVRAVGRTGR